MQKVWEDPLGNRRLLFAFQQFSHTRRHLNTADTGLGLGLADADTAALLDRYRPLNLELVFLEADVLPPEAADLAAAQTRHDLHVEEVTPVLMPLDGFEEGFQLIVTEDLLLGIVALGNGRAVGGVLRQQPLLDRRVKGFVEHHVYPSDHAVSKCFSMDGVWSHAPFFLDFIIEFLHIGRGQR